MVFGGGMVCSLIDLMARFVFKGRIRLPGGLV